jgi:hypothetical protein
MGKWRYSVTHSQPRHEMEVSGQLYGIRFAPPERKSYRLYRSRLGEPQSRSRHCREQKSFCPCQELTLDPLAVHPEA